jgi:hypothetical protein
VLNEDSYELQMMVAGIPAPFFICLYFSAGMFGYIVSRFQLNRHDSVLKNDLEYTRQLLGILAEPTPPSLRRFAEGIRVDCEGESYFPPPRRNGQASSRGYADVGFYNVNWQGHLFHGADRAPLRKRLTSTRPPVNFNDGFLDVWRLKGVQTFLKNPGLRLQTEKKKDFVLTYEGGKGKGMFFQWDGEARFAFSPTGDSFTMYIRKVLNVPMVMGPRYSSKLTGKLDNGEPVRFAFVGDTEEEKQLVRQRLADNLSGKLTRELNATRAEIVAAQLFPAPLGSKTLVFT